MSSHRRHLVGRRYPLSKLMTPYGVYRCPYEHEVIFSRYYHPVIERVAGGPPMALRAASTTPDLHRTEPGRGHAAMTPNSSGLLTPRIHTRKEKSHGPVHRDDHDPRISR